MSLQTTLLSFTKSAPAPKNRVEILLDNLEGDDLQTLQSALRNPAVNGSSLTKALKKEYGADAVTDNSVGEWRRRHSVELLGN
jgi:hypothetical protein